MKRLLWLVLILLLTAVVFGCARKEDTNGVVAGNNTNISAEDYSDYFEEELSSDQGAQAPSDQKPAEQKQDQPAKPQSPQPEQDLSGEAPPDEVIDYEGADWIKVCSYNIKALYNTAASKIDVVEVLSKIDADIVGMQEVDHRNSFTGQVEYLARQLGYPYYHFVLTEEADSEGHGILSKYPIKSIKTVSYKFQNGEPRKYGRYLLDVNGQEIAFYNTHLCTGTWEQTGEEFNELLAAIYKEKIPVVLTGDFNLSLAEQKKRIDVKRLLPMNGLHTMNNGHPWVRWDNIFITTDAFEYYLNIDSLVGIESMDTDASDHKPIWTYIKLKS